MNQKLKTILHTAWHEPRHFFLWLALLSLFMYVAMAILSTVNNFMAFVALGCILCFLVSLPAFLLSLIRPVRPLLAWLLRRRFLVLCSVVTLVALFYAVEDWRGHRAWQEFKRTGEAKGERFDLASFIPPPVPDEQNFFETPLWSDLKFTATNGTVVWNTTNWEQHVTFDAWGPRGVRSPSSGDWIRAHRADLAAWQLFYHGSNNVFAARGGQPTNYFPVAKTPQSPAAAVLLALSRFETNRQALIVSAARPQARFWIDYDAGYGSHIPHLARIKAGAQYLAFHASAELQAGDTATALEDVKLSFRLLEAIRTEPILISHLVRIAVLQIALQPVWEGLADRRWSEADLKIIEADLGRLDFLADCQLALRAERACNLWAVVYVRKTGMSGLYQLNDPFSTDAGPADLGKSVGRVFEQLKPAGWYDQTKVSLARNYQLHLLPLVDLERRIVSPAVAEKSEADLARLRSSRWRPYDFFSTELLPGLTGVGSKFARAQTSVDEARLACALERCRLKHGQFPETLDALVPEFIDRLPHDLINGQPLKYHRTDDGQFVLYSVGWNQTDDGGQVVLRKGGGPDLKQGDWVWRYPAK